MAVSRTIFVAVATLFCLTQVSRANFVISEISDEKYFNEAEDIWFIQYQIPSHIKTAILYIFSGVIP
jgi:hypothetical protein